MRHLSGKKKLNMKSSFRKAYMRNQVINFIKFGHITLSLAGAKETRRLAEKIVTIAAKSNDFNARRKVYQMIPYSMDAIKKVFDEIAPRYVGRPGGYTRILRIGMRASDTANMARLQWV